VVPQFITAFRATDILLVLAGTVAMSVLASIVPAGRIMRADALAVFKA
jgi:ABC-type lipoprotein release transport system permease subunit